MPRVNSDSAYPWLKSVFNRYLQVSAASFAANLFVTWLLRAHVGLPSRVAFAGALALMLVVNFFLARYYIFRAGSTPLGRQFRKYISTSLSFRLGEYVIFLVFSILSPSHYLLLAGTALAMSFGVKFLFYNKWTFRT